MSSTAASGSASMGTTPPYEVDECRGVLRVYSDGSIWRSSKPSFDVPVDDDGSVVWKDVAFDPLHNLHLRIYKPAAALSSAKLPIFYYFHGGGFCIGSRAWPNCQNYCFRLASELQAVVVSPDYRLAPENRLPAALEDGFMAVKWLQAQALSQNPDSWLTDVADFSKVLISGDSAGGNIAHNLAVQLGAGSSDLAPVVVRGYVLLAPFFGGTVRTRSEAEGPKDAFLNLELIDRFWRLSIPIGDTTDHPWVIGWAARDVTGHLSPYSFTLRKTGPEDVMLKVLYCGVDHTDLHQMRSEIMPINYPLVPGHEVVGKVVELGSEVNKFKLGDKVGVGCMVSSCGKCVSCKSKSEQYCSERVLTYGATNKDGTPTHGGFSSAMVVHQKFVVKIPEKLAPEQAAPLLCAGVTAYSPLKQFYNPDKAIKAGILGLGGVGHLAVMIAKAMGHHVTVISSSEKKKVEALEHLHADAFLVSSDAAEMEGAAASLDFILDTVPAFHTLEPYISLLKVGGKLIFVGVATKPLNFNTEHLLLGKKTLTGSFIGSMEETQEILDFWAEKGLTSMIEVVKMDYINMAFDRMERNAVRYRFVLDVAGSNLE